jgi:hypothetical protein
MIQVILPVEILRGFEPRFDCTTAAVDQDISAIDGRIVKDAVEYFGGRS